MAARRRRAAKRLSELPTLWDYIGLDPETSTVDGEVSSHTDTGGKMAEKPVETSPAADIDDLSMAATVNEDLIFISFGSGSSGNSAYLGVKGKGGIIIDAGIDPEKLVKSLADNGIPLSGIQGIIVTHDHSDHVRFAYGLLRRLRHTHIYSTLRTLDGMLRRHSISRRIKDYHKPIFKENDFTVGPFTVTPFEVSHDGADNVGFCIAYGTRRFVVATDMGFITDRADFYIRQANYLMIESNYDDTMLTLGRYPEYLKARIRGSKGHLDNSVTAAYLAGMWTPALTDIYLCHLSEDNNKPEIALSAVIDALTSKGITAIGVSHSLFGSNADVRVSTLPRYDSSPLFLHRLP